MSIEGGISMRGLINILLISIQWFLSSAWLIWKFNINTYDDVGIGYFILLGNTLVWLYLILQNYLDFRWGT